MTMDYLGQTGRDALKGADIIKAAPEQYSSTIEYADNPIAKSLKSVAQVHLADLGTQVFLHPVRQLRHPLQPACPPMPSCGPTFPARSTTSSPTCGSTTLRTT